MRDAVAEIALLMKDGYRLRLQRNLRTGLCSADLSRGLWPFSARVYIPLDRKEFAGAKQLLGGNPKRRIRRVIRWRDLF
jgi:hypothetical protein